MEKSMNLITFDLVSPPSTYNGRIYPESIFLKQVEELNRRIKRKQRRDKIIEIFGDEF
jgi:hypothetical protein